MNDSQLLLPIPSKEARRWTMLCNFALFFGLIFSLGSLLWLLILWQVKKGPCSFINDQGKAALNF